MQHLRYITRAMSVGVLPAPTERSRRFTLQNATQILGERLTLAHGKNSGFGAGMMLHRGDIASGENLRMGDRSQAVINEHKTIVVGCQPRFAQPSGR